MRNIPPGGGGSDRPLCRFLRDNLCEMQVFLKNIYWAYFQFQLYGIYFVFSYLVSLNYVLWIIFLLYVTLFSSWGDPELVSADTGQVFPVSKVTFTPRVSHLSVSLHCGEQPAAGFCRRASSLHFSKREAAAANPPLPGPCLGLALSKRRAHDT